VRQYAFLSSVQAKNDASPPFSVTSERRSAQARLDAFESAIASYFAAAPHSDEQVRRRIETAVGDARSLLNIRPETEDYFVPFALMFVARAEEQFAHAKTLMQIP
jgi:hypothetical protein